MSDSMLYGQKICSHATGIFSLKKTKLHGHIASDFGDNYFFFNINLFAGLLISCLILLLTENLHTTSFFIFFPWLPTNSTF